MYCRRHVIPITVPYGGLQSLLLVVVLSSMLHLDEGLAQQSGEKKKAEISCGNRHLHNFLYIQKNGRWPKGYATAFRLTALRGDTRPRGVVKGASIFFRIFVINWITPL